MNAIATSTAAGALAAIKGLKQGIQNVKSTIMVKGGDPFLRLGKDGNWVYGQEDIEVEGKSHWAANPLSIQHGWIAWNRDKGADNSGGPLGEVMVGLGHPLPPKSSLQDVGHDWDQQISIMMKCLDGADKGEQVLYKTASVGGVGAMDKLIGAIDLKLAEDTDAVVPILSLDSDSYKHPTYGKTYFPVLTITGWMTLDGVEAVEAPEDDPATASTQQAAVAASEPVKATRTRKAAEPAAAVIDPANMTLEQMEALIVQKKLDADKAKAAATAEPAVDPAEERRKALLAQLAELDGPAKEREQAADLAAVNASNNPQGSATTIRRRRT